MFVIEAIEKSCANLHQ
jgi:F-box and leucine-rich repeat protein GRR1